MVRKQVISLEEICIKFVGERVWNFCYARAPSIELEHFPSVEKLQTAKHVLCSLPQTVIQNIYKHILSHEYKLHCERAWDYGMTGLDPDDPRNVVRYYNSDIQIYQTEILYLISLLLGFDEHFTRIAFTFAGEKDIIFISKFGKNIKSLNFKDHNWPPVLSGLLTPSNWRVILHSASNILELDLDGVKYSDQFLKVIGEECNQLKVLRGMVVGKSDGSDGCNDLGLATQNSFKNLFFKSDKKRNMCCNSLQSVHLSMHQDGNSRIFWNTVTLLINNLPNLKSLGDKLIFNPYLQSVCSDEISETNIEEMGVKKLTCDLVSVLTIFFPKVKKIEIRYIAEIEVLHQLSKFKVLEDLCITPFVRHKDQIFGELVSIQWSILRKLTLNLGHVDVSVTTLALNFPVLTELYLLVRSHTWDRKTHFKCLQKLELYLQGCDMSWFESFANTIVHLHVICSESVDAGTRQILLHVPFPCLESLDIIPFPYDFEFYTSVLKSKTLPKLRLCAMYMGYQASRKQYVQELSSFLKKNNLECAVTDCIEGVRWRGAVY